MSKKVNLTVFATGGEYTFGVIEDEAEKQAMLNAIENNEVSSLIYYTGNDGNEESLSSWNKANLLHKNGPWVVGASLIVNGDNKSFDELIDELECTTFTSSNPWVDGEFKKKFSNDALLWGTEQIEKRIHFPVELILADDEDFDVTNVFIGSMNMDETINGAEVVDMVCYIPKEEQIKLIKNYLGEGGKDEMLSEYIGDMIFDHPEILNPFTLKVGDIEGKGETENDFNIVTTFDGEILYKGGEY
jgi:hypothetical protein